MCWKSEESSVTATVTGKGRGSCRNEGHCEEAEVPKSGFGRDTIPLEAFA